MPDVEDWTSAQIERWIALVTQTRSRTVAARILGVSRSLLRLRLSRMRELGWDVPRGRPGRKRRRMPRPDGSYEGQP